MSEITRLRMAVTLAASLLVLTAACAGPSDPANVPQTYSPPVARPSFISRSGQPAAAHLYVSDIGTSKVYRFPIVNGVVASTPDNVLNVAGLPCSSGSCQPPEAQGIAVDTSGNLYVGRSTFPNSGIAEYAPNAGGNATPFRTIALPSRTSPEDVKVDSRGYVYVALYLAGVAIYAPGAHGAAKPVATIPVVAHANDASDFALALGPANTLYVSGRSGTGGTIYTYANPTTKPVLVAQACNSGATTYGLAVGTLGDANWLYSSGGYGGQHSNDRVYAWDGLQDRPCPTQVAGTLRIADRSLSGMRSVALDLTDDELFIAYQWSGVYEVRPQDFKRQTPITTIGAPLEYPWGVALGP